MSMWILIELEIEWILNSNHVSNDNLVFKLRCAINVIYTLDFKFSTKEYKISH